MIISNETIQSSTGHKSRARSRIPIAIIVAGIILLSIVLPASAETPPVKGFSTSVVTDIGMQQDLGSLAQKVNSTSTYKIQESDSEHLKWLLGTSSKSDTAIAFSDGKIQIGSSLKFGPSVKTQLDSELSKAIQLINATDRISASSRRNPLNSAQYYSGDSPVDAEAWRNSGDQLFNTGGFNRSQPFYDKSLALDQTHAETWNNKGAALVSAGRSKEALSCFDKAINLSQSSSHPWNNKGIAQYSLGKADEALECFNRSLTLDQGNAQAWYNKGVALSYLGRYKEALDCYNRSISESYYSSVAWNNKGLATAKVGMVNSSMECFKNAVALNTKYAEPWVNGGVVLQEIGLEAKAKEAFDQAEKLGYTGAKEFQWAGMAPPELMGGSNKALAMPGLGGDAAIIGVLAALMFIRIGRRIY